MNDTEYKKLHMKELALVVTKICIRDTIIEDYHARGSLSKADMKAFIKEVSNKIYTWLYINNAGSDGEKFSLAMLTTMSYPPDNWDRPELDKDIMYAIKLLERA